LAASNFTGDCTRAATIVPDSLWQDVSEGFWLMEGRLNIKTGSMIDRIFSIWLVEASSNKTNLTASSG
jgi:hypothetical protein